MAFKLERGHSKTAQTASTAVSQYYFVEQAGNWGKVIPRYRVEGPWLNQEWYFNDGSTEASAPASPPPTYAPILYVRGSLLPEDEWCLADENVYGYYQGKAGVSIGSFIRRLVYAWQFGDINCVWKNSAPAATFFSNLISWGSIG